MTLGWFGDDKKQENQQLIVKIFAKKGTFKINKCQEKKHLISQVFFFEKKFVFKRTFFCKINHKKER